MIGSDLSIDQLHTLADHQRAEIERLTERCQRMEAALGYYADQYCEGWCQDTPANFTYKDCGGCKARMALRGIEEGTEG